MYASSAWRNVSKRPWSLFIKLNVQHGNDVAYSPTSDPIRTVLVRSCQGTFYQWYPLPSFIEYYSQNPSICAHKHHQTLSARSPRHRRTYSRRLSAQAQIILSPTTPLGGRRRQAPLPLIHQMTSRSPQRRRPKLAQSRPRYRILLHCTPWLWRIPDTTEGRPRASRSRGRYGSSLRRNRACTRS